MNPSGFQDAKLYLLDVFGLAKDALHIYAGLAVFFGVMLIFKLPVRDWRPLVAVLLVAILAEVADIYDTAAIGARQIYWANWHDIWNTMLWPTAIFALARWTAVFER